MHKVAIIQARIGSSRFPKKVLAKINGKIMLQRVIEKISESKFVDQVVVATTTSVLDHEIIQYCSEHKIHWYAGSEEDVLARYYETAVKYQAHVVIRITADCPLFDATVLDQGISTFISGNFDYVTNVLPPTYPDGLDFSIFRFSVLKDAFQEASLPSEREHVVPWIWKNCDLENGTRYRAFNIRTTNDADKSISKMRWTVDYPEDLELVNQVYSHFQNKAFNWVEASQFMLDHPKLFKLNESIVRDEGYLKSLENEVKK
jgi:spore coat polysaccharide biosynthesis protein SpsF (cytidylyltransferase family)